MSPYTSLLVEDIENKLYLKKWDIQLLPLLNNTDVSAELLKRSCEIVFQSCQNISTRKASLATVKAFQYLHSRHPLIMSDILTSMSFSKGFQRKSLRSLVSSLCVVTNLVEKVEDWSIREHLLHEEEKLYFRFSKVLARHLDEKRKVQHGIAELKKKFVKHSPKVIEDFIKNCNFKRLSIELLFYLTNLLVNQIQNDVLDENSKAAIIESFVKVCLESKPEKFLLESTSSFVAKIMTKESFDSLVLSVATRLLKRSPELIIDGLLSIVNSMSDSSLFIMQGEILSNVIGQLKSSNNEIRQKAVTLLGLCLKKSSVEDNNLEMVYNIILKASSEAKPTPPPEIRISFYEVFSSFTCIPNFSIQILKHCVQNVLIHEQSELALLTLLNKVYLPALFSNPSLLDQSEGEPFKRALEGFSQNGKTKLLPSVHRIWIQATATIFNETPKYATISDHYMSFLAKYLESLKDCSFALEKILSLKLLIDTNSIFQNNQSKLEKLIESFVLKNVEKYQDGLDIDLHAAILSFFLSATIGNENSSKINLWHLVEKNESFTRGMAYFLFNSSNHRSYVIRTQTLELIKKMNNSCKSSFTNSILAHLEKWLRETIIPLEQKSFYSHRVCKLLRSFLISSTISTEELQQRSMSMIIVGSYSMLGLYSWINIVNQSGISPRQSFHSYANIAFESITIAFHEMDPFVHEAAINALRTSFILSPASSLEFLKMSWMQSVNFDLLSNYNKEDMENFMKGITSPKENVETPSNSKPKKQPDQSKRSAKPSAKKKPTPDAKSERDENEEITKKALASYKSLLICLDVIPIMVKECLQDIEGRSILMDSFLDFLSFMEKSTLCSYSLVEYLALEKYMGIANIVGAHYEVPQLTMPLALSTLGLIGVTDFPDQWHFDNLDNIISKSLSLLLSTSREEPHNVILFEFTYRFLQKLINRNLDISKNTPKQDPLYVSQIDLATNYLGHHVHVVGNAEKLKRSEIIKCILDLITYYPKLSSKAAHYLVELAKQIGEKCRVDEIDALLTGIYNHSKKTREAALNAIKHLPFPDERSDAFRVNVWLSCHDVEPDIMKLGVHMWQESGMTILPNDVDVLCNLSVHDVDVIRMHSAKALQSALHYHNENIIEVYQKLFSLYEEKLINLEPEYDRYGMVIPSTVGKHDPYENRFGISLSIKECAEFVDTSIVNELMEFMISRCALGDRNESVRRGMLEAALAVVEKNGKVVMKDLMPTLEAYLSQPAIASITHDYIRQAVVIIFGALAKHLEEDDPKIPSIVDNLLSTLDTPSEPVQIAVSLNLPPLVKPLKERAKDLINNLFDKLLTTESFGKRKGAAYGLAGLIKGAGLSCLKSLQIMDRLNEAVENKKNAHHRLGALFTFETLSRSLGFFFEPYVIKVLPLLLVTYGDNSPEIRDATEEVASKIMSRLTGHCVKMVLPSLLASLEERNWRSKKGAVQLLGSMSSLAPKQLAYNLPTIIPPLTEALNDSHAQVQSAAKEALLRFGNIISNPEVKLIVPALISGLCDPNNNTEKSLTTLLNTSFVHYIDAPSLAMIVPIISRGLKERSTEVKKKASQIVGNISSLADPNDILPHLEMLMPSIKEVLVDPVPEARAVTAKALGMLVSNLGESRFPTLIPELLETLKRECVGVDRYGAAQGLSEILGGIGTDKLKEVLPTLILNTGSSKAYTREGFLSVFIYLPSVFGQDFQMFLPDILPSVLRGLADETEAVRSSAFRAAQIFVITYAKTSLNLLLPSLEQGIFDDNWRIRQSSVQLMGNLLFKVTGQDIESDESFGDEHGFKALEAVLGLERRNSVLSALYIARGDTVTSVKQSAIHVWKTIVVNTPRTLKETIHTVMEVIIKLLSSESLEKKQVASQTLSDLTEKFGDQFYGATLPVIMSAMKSDISSLREGACIGLRAILLSAESGSLQDYIKAIATNTQSALTAEDENVRKAAAKTYASLKQYSRGDVSSLFIPTIISQLEQENENTLHGIREVMSVGGTDILPKLLPPMLSLPITPFKARALAALLSSGGSSYNEYILQILEAIITAKCTQDESSHINEAFVALSETQDADSLSELMNFLLGSISGKTEEAKLSVLFEVVSIIFEHCPEEDLQSYLGEWIQVLLDYFGSTNESLGKAALSALTSLCKLIEKEDMEEYIPGVMRSLRSYEDQSEVSVFCMPKGVGPLLPMFLHTVMYGSQDVRAEAVNGIGDLIRLSNEAALKPYITQITGSLIRVSSEKLNGPTKSSVLDTLYLALQKVPLYMKPFLPQLQRTFVKSLVDPSTSVRFGACKALGKLSSMQPRIEPLLTELQNSIKTGTEGNKDAFLLGLYVVLRNSTVVLSDTFKKSTVPILISCLHESGTIQLAASACFGALLAKSTKSDLHHHLTTWNRTGLDEEHGVGYLQSLLEAIISNADVFQPEDIESLAFSYIEHWVGSEKMAIHNVVVRIVGLLLMYHTFPHQQATLCEWFSKFLKEETTVDVKLIALDLVKLIALNNFGQIDQFKIYFIPSLVKLIGDRNGAVKSSLLEVFFSLFGTDPIQTNEIEAFSEELSDTDGKMLRDYCGKHFGTKILIPSVSVGVEDVDIFASLKRNIGVYASLT